MNRTLQVALVICIVLGTASVSYADQQEAEQASIKAVIDSAYRDGICNTGDIAAIKAGFHSDFHLMGISSGRFWKLPIAQWADRVAKNKAEGKYPPKEAVTFTYPLIDITGHAAVVKVHYLRGGQHIYTDYLQLYKFADGWKIMNKIYFSHESPAPQK